MAKSREWSVVREFLQERYGFSFPESFALFYQFVSQLEREHSLRIADVLGLSLASPFDAFDPKTDLASFDPVASARYYDDPPEFFTVLTGDCDGLHFGYYVDDIDTQDDYPIAGYYSRDSFELWVVGFGLFKAFRSRLEQSFDSALSSLNQSGMDAADVEWNRKHVAQISVIRAALEGYPTGDRSEVGELYEMTYGTESQRQFHAPTREHMGIVVAPGQHRDIPGLSEFEGWNYRPPRDRARGFADEAMKALEDGFPGSALQLGKNLWIYKEHSDLSFELLDKAYEALDRGLQRRMLRRFRMGLDLSQHKAFQDLLADPERTNLSVVGENIAKVSGEIAQCRQLMSLFLWNNRLKTLPEEFSELVNLEMLQLRSNQFESFPEVLVSLPKLRDLQLENNPLCQLPESFARFQALEKLSLSGSQWREFPEVLTRSVLKDLSLDGVEIESLPECLADWHCLESLKLKTRRVLQSGPSFQSLVKLRSLELEVTLYHTNNDLELSVPEFIFDCPGLEDLKLSSNQCLIVPAGLARLSGLRQLEIRNYRLEAIPRSVFELSKLELLRISCARLEELPDDIEKLSNLETLDLYGNRLSAVPEALFQLPKLKTVRLSANSFSQSEKARLKSLAGDLALEI